MRGRHSKRRALQEYHEQREAREQKRSVHERGGDRAGLAPCQCVLRGCTDLPRVVVDYRGDAWPTCSGCGDVLGGHMLVDYSMGYQRDEGNGMVEQQPNVLGESAFGLVFSPPYQRTVHWAEFMALVRIKGPAIPDSDMEIIGEVYNNHSKYGAIDPMYLCCSDVRRILRESTRITPVMRRRYAERWLQIIRNLCGEDYFDEFGPPILCESLDHAMKMRFNHFENAFLEFKRENHPLFNSRHNIPCLSSVGRALLYQSLQQFEPEWATQHRKWLGNDTEAVALWSHHVLLQWRLSVFRRHSWVFRWLKGTKSQLKNELMVMLCIKRLQRSQSHVLTWILHPFLLNSRPRAEWQRLLEQLLGKHRRRLTFNSKAPCLNSSSLPSAAFSGCMSSTSQSSRSLMDGPGCLLTSGKSCSTRGSSYFDGLTSEFMALLETPFPKSAAGWTAKYWERITAEQLAMHVNNWKNTRPLLEREKTS